MSLLPFFKSQLREFFRDVRVIAGKTSLRELAASKNCPVSLSTLKALDSGNHVRPDQFKQIGTLVGAAPADWIEWKVRYIEAYLQEYLLSPEADADLNPALVENFADERQRRLDQYASDATWNDRLGFHVADRLRLAGLGPLDLADATGGKTKKKDKHSVKYPTVTALRRGEHVRPEKFGAVCRRLGLNKTDLAALKISYAESYIGEFLLGSDASVWPGFQPTRHARALSLLIFSTQHSDALA